MTWAIVVAALKTRLEAVSGIGKVHSSLRYTKEPPDSSTFGTLFASSGRLNVWQITRKAVTASQVPTDSRERIEYDVLINFAVAVQDNTSEALMQAKIDEVITSLRNGDRTLGSQCHTHSIPQAPTIAHDAFYGLLCHMAELEFKVEAIED